MEKSTKKKLKLIWRVLCEIMIVMVFVLLYISIFMAITTNDPNYSGYFWGIKMTIEQLSCNIKRLNIISATMFIICTLDFIFIKD